MEVRSELEPTPESAFGSELVNDPKLMQKDAWEHWHKSVQFGEGGASVVHSRAMLNQRIEALEPGEYLLRAVIAAKGSANFILSVGTNVIHDGLQALEQKDYVMDDWRLISVGEIQGPYRGVFFYGSRGRGLGSHNELVVRELSLRRVVQYPVTVPHNENSPVQVFA